MESALKIEEQGCWIPRGREDPEAHSLEQTLAHYPLDLDRDRELDLDGKTLKLDPTLLHYPLDLDLDLDPTLNHTI